MTPRDKAEMARRKAMRAAGKLKGRNFSQKYVDRQPNGSVDRAMAKFAASGKW